MAPPATLRKTIVEDEQQTNNSPTKTTRRTCRGEERSPSTIKRMRCGDKGSLRAIRGSCNGQAYHR